MPFAIPAPARRRPLLFLLLFVVCVDMLLAGVLFRLSSGTLRVTFLDVGQGDAILIESPSGVQMLIDAGPPSGAVLRELGRVLPFWDRTIDVLVLSHPDLDHVGGMPDVFARYRVAVVVSGTAEGKSTIALAKDALVAQEGARAIEGKRGVSVELGGGVVADFFAPIPGEFGSDTNDASSIVLVRFGETRFLFSGDLGESGEIRASLREGSMLRAHVLKLGHHGSRSSSAEEWLRTVAPSIAVISAGKENRYGHPHKDVLDRLAALGISAVSTAERGSISFVSDGRQVELR